MRILFLLGALLRYALAEAIYLLANILPGLATVPLWSLAGRLNRHHLPASLNRAQALARNHHSRAWDAFVEAVQAVDNPWNTSASDLYVTWLPGRFQRRFLGRLSWGRMTATAHQAAAHDHALQQGLAQLAAYHTHRALAESQHTVAELALEVWRSVEGDTRAVRWAGVALAWQTTGAAQVRELAAPLIAAGSFVSPLDSLTWAARFLDMGDVESSALCLGWADRWLPDHPETWRLRARIAASRGDRDAALRCWDRALALMPEDVETYLARLAASGTSEPVMAPAAGVRLLVNAPNRIPLGDGAAVSCTLQGCNDCSAWTLHILPPAGWGIVPGRQATGFSVEGRADAELRAMRPDRIRGAAWPVTFLATGPGGHVVSRAAISVPDHRAGRVLVTVTEDHEIHEERGTLDPDMLRRLLVEKSRLAAALGVPWTHVVEAGSVLGLPAHAGSGAPADPWAALARDIQLHLAEQVACGHDIQPHLHIFNDPASEGFPYSVSSAGWHPSRQFLLTTPERRGAWASASPPPGEPGAPDRLKSVERAVAQVEQVGHLGDPDYRPVVWRSGLLDFGYTPEDRAWSSVALRHAGLWADSDVPKPGNPFGGVVPPAFMASLDAPFEPQPGAALLQLPVVANLEGDYVMGPRLLARRARRCVKAVQHADGQLRPGTHLFTLLTHDKFINARRGRDEFDADLDHGDWAVIRRHIAAWQGLGATFVTAREGVKAVLDELAWSSVPWLAGETFVLRQDGRHEVLYTVTALGQGIPVSPLFPRHLLITVPPFLRGMVDCVHVQQDGVKLPVEWQASHCFWVVSSSGQPLECTFTLARSAGLSLRGLARDSDGWQATIAAGAPFRKARVLLVWGDSLPRSADAWDIRCETRPVPHTVGSQGLLLDLPEPAGNMGGMATWKLVLHPISDGHQ